MLFRFKKSRPKNDRNAAPQQDADEQPWRLNFGLSPGPAPARWIRKPVAPADDPAAVKEDAPSQS